MSETEANAKVVDTVTIENLKTVAAAGAGAQAQFGGVVASAMGIAVQNMVANQQMMNSVDRAATGAMVDRLIHLDPVEASALVTKRSGDDIGSQVLSKLAALSGGQIGSKIAGNTPPATPPEVKEG